MELGSDAQLRGNKQKQQFFNTNYFMLVSFHLKALGKMGLSKSDELSTGLEL